MGCIWLEHAAWTSALQGDTTWWENEHRDADTHARRLVSVVHGLLTPTVTMGSTVPFKKPFKTIIRAA